jgi:threonine/homoserine/homoserine lactone efflux protein
MSYVPDLPVLLAFTLAGVVLFATPGPDMSLWLARTLQGGRRAGMAAMLGTSTGCLVHAALAAGGISVLIAASPVAFAVLKVVGALYLLWLAWGAIRHGSVLPSGGVAPVGRALSLGRTYLGGLA